MLPTGESAKFESGIFTQKYFFLPMQNDKNIHPFYQIGFNFDTSVSIDNAVLTMLGKPINYFYEVTEQMLSAAFEAAHDDQPESEIEPSLTDILAAYKEDADLEYQEALADKAGKKIIEEKLDTLRKTHQLIKTAHFYWCAIHDELSKGASSELRTDSKGLITLKSLSDWALKHFNLKILTKDNLTSFNDLNKDIEQMTTKLTDNEIKETRITIALLVDALSKTDDTLVRGDKPNVSQIAGILGTYGSKQSNKAPVSTSASTFKNVIEVAQKAKNVDYKLETLSIKQTKTLHTTLALIYEKLITERFKNENDFSEKIETIADELALANPSLDGQNTLAIQSRIKRALDIKANPDRRK